MPRSHALCSQRARFGVRDEEVDSSGVPGTPFEIVYERLKPLGAVLAEVQFVNETEETVQLHLSWH